MTIIFSFSFLFVILSRLLLPLDCERLIIWSWSLRWNGNYWMPFLPRRGGHTAAWQRLTRMQMYVYAIYAYNISEESDASVYGLSHTRTHKRGVNEVTREETHSFLPLCRNLGLSLCVLLPAARLHCKQPPQYLALRWWRNCLPLPIWPFQSLTEKTGGKNTLLSPLPKLKMVGVLLWKGNVYSPCY